MTKQMQNRRAHRRTQPLDIVTSFKNRTIRHQQSTKTGMTQTAHTGLPIGNIQTRRRRKISVSPVNLQIRALQQGVAKSNTPKPQTRRRHEEMSATRVQQDRNRCEIQSNKRELRPRTRNSTRLESEMPIGQVSLNRATTDTPGSRQMMEFHRVTQDHCQGILKNAFNLSSEARYRRLDEEEDEGYKAMENYLDDPQLSGPDHNEKSQSRSVQTDGQRELPSLSACTVQQPRRKECNRVYDTKMNKLLQLVSADNSIVYRELSGGFYCKLCSTPFEGHGSAVERHLRSKLHRTLQGWVTREVQHYEEIHRGIVVLQGQMATLLSKLQDPWTFKTLQHTPRRRRHVKPVFESCSNHDHMSTAEDRSQLSLACERNPGTSAMSQTAKLADQFPSPRTCREINASDVNETPSMDPRTSKRNQSLLTTSQETSKRQKPTCKAERITRSRACKTSQLSDEEMLTDKHDEEVSELERSRCLLSSTSRFTSRRLRAEEPDGEKHRAQDSSTFLINTKECPRGQGLTGAGHSKLSSPKKTVTFAHGDRGEEDLFAERPRRAQGKRDGDDGGSGFDNKSKSKDLLVSRRRSRDKCERVAPKPVYDDDAAVARAHPLGAPVAEKLQRWTEHFTFSDGTMRKYKPHIDAFLQRYQPANMARVGFPLASAQEYYETATADCNKSAQSVVRSALMWLDAKFSLGVQAEVLPTEEKAARKDHKKPHRVIPEGIILEATTKPVPEKFKADQIAFLLQYSLAARAQDLAGLKYSDILSADIYNPKHTKKAPPGHPHRLVRLKPKKSDTERQIWLEGASCKRVDEFRLSQDAELHDVMFRCHKSGRPLNDNAMRQRISRFMAWCGCGGRTHDLRKTRASELYRTCGSDLEAIRMLLGHQNISTTQKYIQSDLTQLWRHQADSMADVQIVSVEEGDQHQTASQAVNAGAPN